MTPADPGPATAEPTETATWAYPDVARAAVDHVLHTQIDAIGRACALIADAISRGGLLQAYGTGHSRIVTLELSARAGGLVPVGMLAVKDLVMFGGGDPDEILDPKYEREPGLAARILQLADIAPQDVFLIVSNSGINPAIVEMADQVTRAGHLLVVITSLSHTGATSSRAGSGRRLVDFADIVIDNGAPRGDAALDLGGGRRIGAVSSLTGVLIAQLLTEGICRRLMAQGREVPVFISANLPEGDAHNDDLLARYAARVRPIEP